MLNRAFFVARLLVLNIFFLPTINGQLTRGFDHNARNHADSSHNNGNHLHSHSHAHDHDEEHPTENSVFDPDGPFSLLGKEWKNNQEFINSGARCGSHHSIEQKFTTEKLLKDYRSKVKPFGAPPSSNIEIETYIHIIMDENGIGAITDEMVQDQMKVLNDAYGGRPTTFGDVCGHSVPPSGVNTEFSFKLMGTTRTENSELFHTWNTKLERKMKALLREGDCSTLNIYYNNGGGWLGYSTFPNECSEDMIMDGVVAVFSSVPGSERNPYDRGFVATHEVGHWLGLYHTFEGSCKDGDGLSETPAERSAASGCPEGRNSCLLNPGDDPIYNFMDYTYDCCMSQFVEGQDSLMRDFWNMYRGSKSKQILSSLMGETVLIE